MNLLRHTTHWLLIAALALLPLQGLSAGEAAPSAPASMVEMHDHHGQMHGECADCGDHAGPEMSETCHGEGCASMGHCCFAFIPHLPVLPEAYPTNHEPLIEWSRYVVDLTHEGEPPRHHLS